MSSVGLRCRLSTYNFRLKNCHIFDGICNWTIICLSVCVQWFQSENFSLDEKCYFKLVQFSLWYFSPCWKPNTRLNWKKLRMSVFRKCFYISSSSFGKPILYVTTTQNVRKYRLHFVALIANWIRLAGLLSRHSYRKVFVLYI